MAKAGHGTSNLMNNFIVVLVGIVLAPIVYASALSANVTGTTATILGLIPVFFSLGVLFASLKGLV
jgi:hypothetical protein